MTDDRPPLPAFPNREAAQKIKILCRPMDQVPKATGEWGEKKYPGKGQRSLSRGARRSLRGLTPQVHSQFKGGLTPGSLCPFESQAFCKGPAHRGSHRELLSWPHSWAGPLQSPSNAQNYRRKMDLEEARVQIGKPQGQGQRRLQARYRGRITGERAGGGPSNTLTWTAASAAGSGPALPGRGARSHSPSGRGRRHPSKGGPG